MGVDVDVDVEAELEAEAGGGELRPSAALSAAFSLSHSGPPNRRPLRQFAFSGGRLSLQSAGIFSLR